jgi:cellulose synthase operon protein C
VSLLAATQIPKPADEQAFERASVVLWRCILNDPNVQRHGRRGQRQNGVDVVGIRNGDAGHLVGIQCKLKSDGHELTEKEVRDEIRKAITFSPSLREYFITTTAPDDAELQQIAREISVDLTQKGHSLLIHVWGWNTLEERISEHAEARKAFDPDFGPFSGRILEKVAGTEKLQAEIKTDLSAGLSTITATLARVEANLARPPGDSTLISNALEAHLDAEIDTLRGVANAGKPLTAQGLLEQLLARVSTTASGRIMFRIKANIGSCLYALGKDSEAALLFSEAYDHAPSEPKAAANKALSLLIEDKRSELMNFARRVLHEDPTNESVASYFVQAARDDPTIEDPLALIPEQVRSTFPVAIARVDFLRYRHRVPDWYQVARDALAIKPDDALAQQLSADADLDEILGGTNFKQTGRLATDERERIADAAKILEQQWNKARDGEGAVRTEHIAIGNNLIVALHALGELSRATEVARQGLSLAPSDDALLVRATLAAIDAHDDDLAQQLLPRLSDSTDALVLRFRFHSMRGAWKEVAELCRTHEAALPTSEKLMMTTAGRLAELKIHPTGDIADQLSRTMEDVAGDARASVVVADFATMLGHAEIGNRAYENAINNVNEKSHIAARLMVAMQAAKRRDWTVVVDLLDGHVAEDLDGEELQTLAIAFVNDTPIRKRAVRFFGRLPKAVSNLPFYLSARARLHFNQGALSEAETFFRKAVAIRPRLIDYLGLFSTLRRVGRQGEIASTLVDRI